MSTVYEVATKLTLINNASGALAVIAKEVLTLEGGIGKLNKALANTRTLLAVGGGLAVAGGIGLLTALKHVADHGDKLLDQQDKLQRAGMRLNDVLKVQGDYYNKIAKTVPTATASDYLRTFNEMRSVVGADKAQGITPWALKLEAIIANATGKSAEGEGFKMWRAMEMRGTSMSDPKGTSKLAGALAQNIIGSGGKLDANTYQNLAKRGGVSWINASPEYIAGALSVVAADLGGDTAGTADMTAYNFISGATSLKNAQLLELRKLDALNEHQIGWNKKTGNPVMKVDSIKGQAIGLKDRYRWVNEVLMPREHLLYGDDETKIAQSLAIIGSNRNTQRMFTMYSQPGFREQIEKDKHLWHQASTVEGAYSDALKRNPKMIKEAFNSQYESMMEAIGAPMMQAALPVMKAITDLFTKVGAWANSNPQGIKLIAEGIAGLGVVMIGAGVTAILAAIGPAGWFTVGFVGLSVAFREFPHVSLSNLVKAMSTDIPNGIAQLKTGFSELMRGFDVLWSKIKDFARSIMSLLPGGGGSYSDSAERMRNMSALGGGGPGFAAVAPQLMTDLQKDYGLTKEQAAGIIGNLGHESAGFTAMQEGNPIRGKGGWGWAQWTGPRRREFMDYAASHGFGASSYAANYGMLKHDLDGRYHDALLAVKGSSSAHEAMMNFERTFEKAGIKAYGSRATWTRRALGVGGPPPKSTGQKESHIHNIWLDGRKFATAMSEHVSRLHEHSTQSPFFNGRRMFTGPDSQFAAG